MLHAPGSTSHHRWSNHTKGACIIALRHWFCHLAALNDASLSSFRWIWQCCHGLICKMLCQWRSGWEWFDLLWWDEGKHVTRQCSFQKGSGWLSPNSIDWTWILMRCTSFQRPGSFCEQLSFTITDMSPDVQASFWQLVSRAHLAHLTSCQTFLTAQREPAPSGLAFAAAWPRWFYSEASWEVCSLNW